MTEIFIYVFMLAWTGVTIKGYIDQRENKKRQEEIITKCDKLDKDQKKLQSEVGKVKECVEDKK